MTTQLTQTTGTGATSAAGTAGPAAPPAGPAAHAPRPAPRRRAGGTARRVGLRQTLANGLTLAWRNVMQLKHSPEKLMDVTLMPIVFLVLFLYVFGGVVAGSTHGYLELLLPGLVGQMAMFATMGLGTALCEDIHKGVFDRFRSLPIARSAPLIGAVLGDTVRAARPAGRPGARRTAPGRGQRRARRRARGGCPRTRRARRACPGPPRTAPA